MSFRDVTSDVQTGISAATDPAGFIEQLLLGKLVSALTGADPNEQYNLQYFAKYYAPAVQLFQQRLRTSRQARKNYSLALSRTRRLRF